VSIGTLNEGPLHQAVKALYLEEGATEEVTIGSFVADVVAADDTLVEVQTAGFGSMKRKLAALLEEHRVVLVHPIAAVRYIVKLPTEQDQPATRRRSPKRGTVSHVLDELVSIPTLLCHPNFELEVLMIEEEELRAFDPKRVRRRSGWRVVQRRLQEVLGRERFTSPADLFRLAPGDLPEEFTTADLAAAMDEPRWLAQKLAYCLRESGEITICGKQGNALRYQRGAASMN
tara:strand:- start:3525 stop:4217 length:693 start_codon:yes stop_codon:yes gene_type:complete